jgi:hypothetical protein
VRGGWVKVLCVELGRGVCGMVRGAVCGGGGGRRGRFLAVVSEGVSTCVAGQMRGVVSLR